MNEDHKGKMICKKIEACLLERRKERVCGIHVDNVLGNYIAIGLSEEPNAYVEDC